MVGGCGSTGKTGGQFMDGSHSSNKINYSKHVQAVTMIIINEWKDYSVLTSILFSKRNLVRMVATPPGQQATKQFSDNRFAKLLA